MMCLVSTTIWDPGIHASIHCSLVYHTQMINQLFDGTWNTLNPFAYASDEDTSQKLTLLIYGSYLRTSQCNMAVGTSKYTNCQIFIIYYGSWLY